MVRPSVIIGAGLAGLTAAYYLQKAVWAVSLGQRTDRVGGRVATVRRDATCWTSVQRRCLPAIVTTLPCAMKWEFARGWSIQVRTSGVIRRGRIYLIDGRRVLSAPLSGLLSLRGKWAVLRTIGDFMRLSPGVDARDVSLNFAADVESCATYAARRVGSEVYDALIDPLVRAYVINRGSNVSVLEWFSS